MTYKNQHMGKKFALWLIVMVVSTTLVFKLTGCDTNPENESITALSFETVRDIKVKQSTFFAGFKTVDEGVTVGYHGATYVTTDGGETWVKGENEANCRYGLDFFSDSGLWTIGNYGGNRVSLNGGLSLYPVTDLPLVDQHANNLIDIVSTQVIWEGSPVNLAYSKDAGYTWHTVTLPPSCDRLSGICFYSETAGIIMSSQACLYMTEDSGSTWKEIGCLPVKESIKKSETPSVAMHFEDETQGYVLFTDTTNLLVGFSTDDGGVNWTAITLPKIERSSPYLNPEGDVLTATDSWGNIKVLILN